MKKTTNYFRTTLTIAIFILAISAINAAAATFTVSNTNDSGAGSLRQAVLSSNTAAGSDTIVFDASFNTPRTITLASTITIDPATGDSLTITGPGANLLTVSGNNAVQIFFVSNGDTAAISGMTLTQGRTFGSGGVIDNRGSLSVSNVAFDSNFGNNGGGAIHSEFGTTLTITNSSFTSNSSIAGSGAISNNGNLTVTNSTFASNTGASGGAIFHGSNGTVMVSGCAFTNNISNGGGATGNGGGAIINVGGGTITISDSTFTGNSVQTTGSGPSGGAIRNRFGTMNITNSTFSNNTAANGGGAIDNSAVLSISGSTFTGNSATGPNAFISGLGSGGAISSSGGEQMTINNSVISGNLAVNHGGGIYITASTVNINNTTVSNNVANANSGLHGDGGGVWIRAEGRVTVSGSTISGNRTNRNMETTDLRFAGKGGGFFVEGALTLNNSTVSGNFAELYYGGIADTNPGGSEDRVDISNSTIVNNRAVVNVGGFGVDSVSDANDQSVRNTIIANNTSGGPSQDVYSTTSAPINSLGYNLIKNTTGATIVGTTTGNLYGVDPLLGPLANNGGATRTHALRPGSPAIDAGDPTTFPATDQRGISRPQDGDGNGTARSDIGAFERRPNEVVHGSMFDFDGDGRTDISVFRPSEGQYFYLRSSDGVDRGFPFGSGTDKPVPADFTGDGKTDIAFFRPSTGQWFVLRSEDNSFFAFPFGSNGDIPAPGDFDGDGKADVAVFRPSIATWFIRNSSDGSTTIRQFGLSGDVPIVEDYDGDGKADLAVYRPSASEWYLQRSRDGFIGFRFGAVGDTKPVPADFTGDGKADIAFFAPSTGRWFVLRSEDASFFAFPFGTSTDIPAPGDYDGDGKADAAVYRQSAGLWYLNQTTSGQRIVPFGAENDKPLPAAFLP